MALKRIIWFAWFSSVTVVYGAVQFSCESPNPLEGSSASCTCKTDQSVQLIFDGNVISTCATSGICIPDPPPAGYSVSTNVANAIKEYTLSIQTFSYTSCGKYSCKDLSSNEEKDKDLIISDFDKTVPSAIDEPANKEGDISITTDCLFRESDIVVNWYTVEGDQQKPYQPEKKFSESTACSDTCSGEAAVTLKIGFNHSEETSILKQKVKFRIEVYHSADENSKLVLTTSKDYYIIGSTTPSPTTSTISAANTTGSSTSLPNVTDSDDKKTIIGVSVGVVIAVVLAISIGVCCFCKYKNRQTKTERSENKMSYDAKNRL